MGKTYIIEKIAEPEELGEAYVSSLSVIPGEEDDLTDGIDGLILKRREMSAEEAEAIEARSHVLRVTEDVATEAFGKVEASDLKADESLMVADALTSTMTDVQKFHGFNVAHQFGYKGQGRRVAILDTGLDETWANKLGKRLFKKLSKVKGEDWKDTGSGHGTHVTGTVAFNAPSAQIVVIKVLSTKSGGGTMSVAIEGINEAVKIGCTDINMSLGGDGDANSPVSRAVDSARGKGVQVNVAAGNNQRGRTDFQADKHAPAASRLARTWASINLDRSLASYSNWGNCLDGSAVGDSQNSWGLRGLFAVMSGTSQATPVGCAAGAVCASEGATPPEVDKALYANAGSNGLPGYKIGRGIIDVEFSVKALRSIRLNSKKGKK